MSSAPQLPGFLSGLAGTLDSYGYFAVAGLVFLEDFGVPVPGETVLIAAAVEAGAGKLNVVTVALVGFLAAVLGDNLGYLIGRRGGRPLLLRFGRPLRLTPERLDRLERFVTGRGGLLVIVARFVEGLRQANGLIAGVIRMPWWRFLLFNALGAALWVATWVTVGVTAGSHLASIYSALSSGGVYTLAAVAVLLVVFLAYRHRRRRPAGATRAVHAAGPGHVDTPTGADPADPSTDSPAS